MLCNLSTCILNQILCDKESNVKILITIMFYKAKSINHEKGLKYRKTHYLVSFVQDILEGYVDKFSMLYMHAKLWNI